MQNLITKIHQSDEEGGPFKLKTIKNSYRDSNDDDEQDEQSGLIEFKEDTGKFYNFIYQVIKEFVVLELKTPEDEIENNENHDLNPHERQYGLCRKPFGILRMRVVEFLTEAFKAFFRKDLHQLFLDSGLYNSLLFFFDHYPFHNMLHQRICEMFMSLLD